MDRAGGRTRSLGYNWDVARRRYDQARLRAALDATGAILRDRYGEPPPAPRTAAASAAGAAPAGAVPAGAALAEAVVAAVLRLDDLARRRREEPPHDRGALRLAVAELANRDRKSTRLNSSH